MRVTVVRDDGWAADAIYAGSFAAALLHSGLNVTRVIRMDEAAAAPFMREPALAGDAVLYLNTDPTAVHRVCDWPLRVRRRTGVLTLALHRIALAAIEYMYVSTVTETPRGVPRPLADQELGRLLATAAAAAAADRRDGRMRSGAQVARAQAAIVRLLMAGFDTAEIAERLCINAKTVNAQISSLLRLEGVANRTVLLGRLTVGYHR